MNVMTKSALAWRAKAAHGKGQQMQFPALVSRITGEGANAWLTHYQALAARERGEDVIVLSVGDPPFDTSAAVVERAVERLRAGDTHYTPGPGRAALRAAIAATHARRTGQQVGVDQVICFAGAQNALFAASLCLAGPGDEVIAFDPLYPTYPATIEVSGAKLVRTPSPADAGFRPDLAAFEAAITPRTRAVFLATPNNPSGVVLNAAELAVIGALARRHSLWIVVDEVYAGLGVEGRVPGLAAILPEQVVTISSLSKSHAMTGWRAGWMVGPAPLVAHAEALVMCMLFGLPGFIQEAAITALGMAGTADEIRSTCAARRDVVLEALAGAPGLQCCVPQAGMFMLIDVRGTGLSGYDFMRGLYESERVSVLDGGAFGRGTAGFVRLCFGNEEAALRVACQRMRRHAARVMKT
jgi:aspartate/methionine/tyrosine aminotransferase